MVRASDAHAWVEAWIEGPGNGSAQGRWVTFDPTPFGPAANRTGLFSRINMYLDAADHAWQEWVVSYDLTQQVAMAARFEAALRAWNRTSSAPSRNWTALAAAAVTSWGKSWGKSWGAALFAALLFAALLARFASRYWRGSGAGEPGCGKLFAPADRLPTPAFSMNGCSKCWRGAGSRSRPGLRRPNLRANFVNFRLKKTAE